ncbi:hypothetical protein, partial [Lyngbya sp. CCY1209]|uniref:hypothetical protein n=1 Tax=Lyngbya sp. CCY1209 TaxID=2886103 RepID=UPI002D2022D7
SWEGQTLKPLYQGDFITPFPIPHSPFPARSAIIGNFIPIVSKPPELGVWGRDYLQIVSDCSIIILRGFWLVGAQGLRPRELIPHQDFKKKHF